MHLYLRAGKLDFKIQTIDKIHFLLTTAQYKKGGEVVFKQYEIYAEDCTEMLSLTVSLRKLPEFFFLKDLFPPDFT